MSQEVTAHPIAAPAILVIDDDGPSRRLTAALLGAAGYRTLEAETSRDGLESALSKAPELILLDVHLPDGDGIDLCRRLKSRPELAHCLVVLISAMYTSSDWQIEGLEAGADGYITRPIENRELLARVEAMLRIQRTEKELRRAQDRLSEAQKLESLGILAGGVAHDFNNLLAAMLGHNSLALAKLPPESPARPHVQKAIHAAERAAELTRQMLAYSGRGHFQLTSVDLSTLVRENLHLLEASIPKNVRLTSRLLDPLPPIRADLGQMQQIVMNLVINGAEALGARHGQVVVRTQTRRLAAEDGHYWHHSGNPLPPGPYVSIEVEDDGDGMDTETLNRIFDPFFTTKFTGRGLGLSAVLGIVHGGGLSVCSAPGQGTLFELVFPAAAAAATAEAVEGAVEGEATWGLILVIDDEEAVREVACDILRDAGYQVASAENGRHGLRAIQELGNSVRLVLLDLSMPEMNGAETFRELRRVAAELPVVLTSGYTEEEAVHTVAGQSLAGFLRKPFDAVALLEAVRRGLRETDGIAVEGGRRSAVEGDRRSRG